MHLKDMPLGSKGFILKLKAGEKGYRQRLIALGLTPGTAFSVVRVAPLGDPIEIIVRDVALCLRLDEAAILEVVRA